MKRTFVVPDEKEDVYVKFKELVPEVSRKLVEMMEEYVNKHEAIQAGLEEQTGYRGTERDNIFAGKTFKFYGVKIADNMDTNSFGQVIYFTKKGKFVVTTRYKYGDSISYQTLPYDDYFVMIEKGALTKQNVMDCAAYLDKNSDLRTYEVLDV